MTSSEIQYIFLNNYQLKTLTCGPPKKQNYSLLFNSRNVPESSRTIDEISFQSIIF